MPTLNLDVVTGMAVDVEATTVDGEVRTWKLRGDVPSSILVRCLYLVEIEQDRPGLEIDLDKPLDYTQIQRQEAALVAHQKYEEQTALEICGAIWRWTDPAMTDEEIARMLPPAKQKELVKAFFSLLLLRFGKLPASATASSSRTDSSETQNEGLTTQTTETTEKAETFPSSRAADSTLSETPLPAASSSLPRTAPLKLAKQTTTGRTKSRKG